MVSWYKRDGDAAMPSTKNLLLARYEETKHRGERCMTPPTGGVAGGEEDPDSGSEDEFGDE